MCPRRVGKSTRRMEGWGAASAGGGGGKKGSCLCPWTLDSGLRQAMLFMMLLGCDRCSLQRLSYMQQEVWDIQIV